MRRLLAAVFLLSACSAELASSIAEPDAAPLPDDASAPRVLETSVQEEGGTDVVDSAVEEDAAPDAAPDAELDANPDATLDAGTPDAAPDAGTPDAAPDAELDATLDAEPDAGTPDAEPDAPADTGPPPVCNQGTFRCFEYQKQKCISNAWVWQVGDQSCCHDPRFTVSGTVVTDSATGRKWYRYGGQGAGTGCSAVIPNGRLPSTSELSAIVIGTPVNNTSVCSPTIDQVAFQTVNAGDTVTSDGCVDLLRGISKVACTSVTVGHICTAD